MSHGHDPDRAFLVKWHEQSRAQQAYEFRMKQAQARGDVMDLAEVCAMDSAAHLVRMIEITKVRP